MRAMFIARHGGPQTLELRDIPDPQPGPGEVRIRVRAAGINFSDLLMRMGLYVGAPPPPFIPGYEIAGEIEALGAGVKGPDPGTPVLAVLKFGGYAEKAVCPARQLSPLPAGKSFEEAAALPVNYLTAYHALFVLGNLREESRVLIHQAAGGVGVAALQLAKLRNATVYGTASASKHAWLARQGLAAAIDYRNEDFERRVRELTGGRGVHLALDPVGGRSFLQSYRCLAPSGLLVCYGASASAPTPASGPLQAARTYLQAAWTYLSSGLWSPLQLMVKNKGVVGFHLGLLDDQALMAQEMAELLKLWAGGKIRPHVDKAFPVQEAAQAHRYIHERRNLGKVVLTF